ncbi:hypothetical protein I6G37_00045 [Serratia rubidaea]|nr:hypothetical protein I6G37_00045 [Serratia rubidaea]
MFLYILVSALYRLSCGALILAINWIMVKNNDSPTWLAALVALTFLPAIIVPMIWKNTKNINGNTLTIWSLIGASFITFSLFITENTLQLLIINTVLWFFFFVMESSWESWFASITYQHSKERLEHYSSVSMSINQASLMLGPVVAAIYFEHIPRNAILCCALIFLFTGLITLFLSKKTSPTSTNDENSNSKRKEIKIRITGIEISLLFIWPTLALFNFMLPVQVSYSNGSMIDVGFLDAAIGVGMVFSGLLISNDKFKHTIIKYKLNLFIILFGAILWAMSDYLFIRCASVFLLGLAFNIERILIRSTLAMRYDSHTVGKIISGANAFSFFIISLSLLMVHSKHSINWLVPFVFCGIICLLLIHSRRALNG